VSVFFRPDRIKEYGDEVRVNIIFLILCSLALASAGCSREETVDENAFQNREWAFLFYDDADSYEAYDPWDDFIRRMFSTENMHVLVLRDRGHEHGGIYYINPDQTHASFPGCVNSKMK
jgi:hypothetical protein